MHRRHIVPLATAALGLFLSTPALAQDASENADTASDDAAAAEVEVDTADSPDDAGISPPVAGYAPPLPPPPPPAVIAPPPPAPSAGYIAPIEVVSRAGSVLVMRVETWDNMVIKYGGSREQLLRRIHSLDLDPYQIEGGTLTYKPKSRSSYVFIPVCMAGGSPRAPKVSEVVTLASNAAERRVVAHCQP